MIELDMDEFKLTVGTFTPETVDEMVFSIPVYQRLYAWEDKQITDLLNDFKSSLEDEVYYLGNITTDLNEASRRNDLIDGQQRITTLFLIATLLVQYDERWNRFLNSSEVERLIFPSRNEDMKYLRSIADGEQFDDDEVNRRLPAARKIILDFIQNQLTSDSVRTTFSRFIYEKVTLVYVILPKGTDMNWYFEVMNSRGEQLEKHEILKARILDKVPQEKRFAYSRIWNACSQMDNYLEDVLDDKAAQLILSYNGTDTSLHNIISHFDTDNYEGEEPHTLVEILKANKKYNSKEEKRHEVKISSIISFSELLLTTFCTCEDTISDNYSEKNLLQIIDFAGKNQDMPVYFIEHLLKTRLLFDSFVIKSLFVDNLYKWDISFNARNEEASDKSYMRKKMKGMLTDLQAMLNVSVTQSELWLVPLIHYIQKNAVTLYQSNEEYASSSILSWLEKLDDQMAESRISGNKTFKQIAIDNMKNHYVKKKSFEVPKDVLSRGTGTERYWFFKLDYCLLKIWRDDIPQKHIKNEKLIKRFQFRQSRSVEHVYPQNPEQQYEIWPDDNLHSFGNLALITNSTNSSYNHFQPAAKKIQFQLHNEKWGVESLKLLEIYNNDSWNMEDALIHESEMINILNQHSSEN